MGSHANLLVGCLWILLSFISGLFSGLNFHKEDWLGGYGSFRRRLYRLAHISFFGLGTVNCLYYLIAERIPFGLVSAQIASWGFIVGAVTMPICCYAMAHDRKLTAIFAVPVLSLVTAGIVTLVEVSTL